MMIPKALRQVRRARELATAQFVKDFAIHETASVQAFLFEDIIELATELSRKKSTETREEIYGILIKIFSPDTFDLAANGTIDNSQDDIVLMARKLISNTKMRARYEKIVDHFALYAKDVALFNNSASTLPKRERERIKRVRQHFEDLIPNSFSLAEKLFKKQSRDFEPETAIFQGGGQKGMGYVGSIIGMSQRNMIRRLKHVGGTSAGALIGLPLALGFSASEIKDIATYGRFAQFFSQGTSLLRIKSGISVIYGRIAGNLDPSDEPFLEGFNLVEFSGKFMLPALALETGVSEKDLKKMTDVELNHLLSTDRFDIDGVYKKAHKDFRSMLEKSNRQVEIGVLQFGGIPGRSEGLQAAITAVRSLRSRLHKEKDLIESFIADIVETSVSRYLEKNPDSSLASISGDKNRIRSMNFKELEMLASETQHAEFKEFGVAITRSHLLSKTLFKRYFKKLVGLKGKYINGKDSDPGYGAKDTNVVFEPVFVRAGGLGNIDMPIKKAVRISMNLPVMFHPIDHDGGNYYDGGINSNFPHRMFLDKYEESIGKAEDMTIGFVISSIDSDMENQTAEKMFNAAVKFINVELERHPSTMKERLKNAGNDLMYAIKDIGVNLFDGSFKEVGKKIIYPAGYIVSKVLGKAIMDIMNKNNSAIPSAGILDNTAVINSGDIRTSDFHQPNDKKEELFKEGETALSRLMSVDYDNQLMYSVARLLSIIKAENKVLRKYKYDEFIKIPAESIINPYLLIETLKQLTDSDLNTFDVIGGFMGEIKHRKHHDTGASPG